MNLLTQIIQYTTTSLIPQQQPKYTNNRHKQHAQSLLSQPSTNTRECIDMCMVQLPSNYAQLIMQLQMQIQSSMECNVETVCKLNQLYMIGIQYYGRMGIEQKWKVQHFSKKLIGLFNNVEVNRIITRNRDRNISSQAVQHVNEEGIRTQLLENQRNINTNDIDSKQYVKVSHNNNKNTPTNPILYTANLKQQLSKFTSQSDNVIKNIIEINSKKQQRSNRLINNDLENQQHTFKKRLEQRIRSRSKRSEKIERADRNDKKDANKSREKSRNLDKQNINKNQ